MAENYTYDIEVYPNVFLLGAKCVETGRVRCWEISHRINEAVAISRFIKNLTERAKRSGDVRMVGFRNVDYDYPILHHLVTTLSNYTDAEMITDEIYDLSSKIINDKNPFNKWAYRIRDYQTLVPQTDLSLLNHFDNNSRRTSLKSINFAMRQQNIIELPFKPGSYLSSEQIEVLKYYLMEGDIPGTENFYHKCKQKIAFRVDLSKRFGVDMMNYSNSKIGSTFFVKRIEERLGKDACYYKENGKRKIRQTIRESVKIAEVILPKVDFKIPQFKAILDWLKAQEITETKKVFSEIEFSKVQGILKHADNSKKNGKLKNLNVIVDGIKFVFGTGGIHASVKTKSFRSTGGMKIVDIDAKSYYPWLSIANRIYPQHLGEDFCDINLELFEERITHESGTTLNLAIKEALNATYGNSNSEYSPIFDRQYTMAITVNGQLLLCMMYEKLRKIESLQLVQMNTDGITVYYHQDDEEKVLKVTDWWQKMSGITLESVEYREMHVRDVNNYIAVSAKNGKVKRKGKYEWDLISTENWHKNFSALVVPKAVEKYFLNGDDIEETIKNHDDDYDFFLCTKVNRTSRLESVTLFENEETQRISRYYVTTDETCPYLYKVMPPTKGKTEDRWIAIDKGYRVKVCNDTLEIDRSKVNYDYYIERARKLINFEGEDYDGDY